MRRGQMKRRAFVAAALSMMAVSSPRFAGCVNASATQTGRPSFEEGYAEIRPVRSGKVIHFQHYLALPGMPTFVLLHGNTADLKDWSAVVDILISRGAGVLAVDLLGQGETLRYNWDHGYADARAVSEVRFLDNVQAVADVIKARGVKNIRLVGHSSGGAIAHFLAGGAPAGLVTGLHLLTPYVYRVDGGSITNEAQARIFLTPFFRDAITRRLGERGERINEFFLGRRVEAGIQLTLDLLPFDARAFPLPKELPVQIIFGSADRLNKRFLVRGYLDHLRREGNRADLVEHPGLGHYLPTQAPAAMAADLLTTVESPMDDKLD